MDFISAVWDWMGRNSGQIQIFIAVMAFGIAYKGYMKLLRHRQIDSQLVFINLLHDSYRETTKLHQYCKDLEDIAIELNMMENLSEEDRKLIIRNLQYIGRWKKKLREIQKGVEDLYTQSLSFKANALEQITPKFNQSLKEFIKASNGFHVAETNFKNIKNRYNDKN